MNARAVKGKKGKSKRGSAGQKARFARMDQELGVDADRGVFGTALDLLFPAKPAKGRRKR